MQSTSFSKLAKSNDGIILIDKSTFDRLKFLLSIAGAVAIILGGLALPLVSIDFQRLSGLGYFGVLIGTFIGSAAGFLPAPNMLIVLVASTVWSPIGVGIAGGIGSAVGEIPNYIAGRLGASLVINHPRYASIQTWVEGRYGLVVIFLFAALPNPVYDIVGLGAGALHLSLTRFFLPCLFGKLLRFVMIAYLGSHLDLFNKIS